MPRIRPALPGLMRGSFNVNDQQRLGRPPLVRVTTTVRRDSNGWHLRLTRGFDGGLWAAAEHYEALSLRELLDVLEAVLDAG